jgi:ABC-type Na+ efflux pump permease subunit
MKALIYKDLVAVWKYCRRYLFLCGLCLALSVVSENAAFLQMYPLILVGSLGSTLIAYDERDKWDRQVLTMPISRRQYVSAKYLTGLILQCTVLVLTAAAHGLQLRLAMDFSWNTFWMDLSMMAVLASASPSLILPFIFKNGSEKGRMAYLIVLGSIFALMVGGGIVLERLDLLDAPMVVPMPGLLAAIAAALYPISWALSVRWYEKREF